MLSSAVLSPQALLESIFVQLQIRHRAHRFSLPQPIRMRITANNPDQTVEKQLMEYQDFLYIDLELKKWVVCLGMHQTDNGDHYSADLSALPIFNRQLKLKEAVKETKARLGSSRTFYHSLLCGRTDNVLCFPLESRYCELMQALSVIDPNSFWVEPRYRHVDLGDNVFREPHSQSGFFQDEALGHFIDLIDNILLLPDERAQKR